MWNCWDKLCTKSKHKFYFSITPPTSPTPENRAVYEIIWENVVGPGRPQMAIRRMRIACWMHKATNTQSEYVILIAFHCNRWFRGRTSVLRYTYFACLVHSFARHAVIWIAHYWPACYCMQLHKAHSNFQWKNLKIPSSGCNFHWQLHHWSTLIRHSSWGTFDRSLV